MISVDIPAALELLINVQHLLFWSQERFMFIGAVTNLAEEVREVGLFGESCELRGVVEPHIEEALDAMSFQRAEEFAGVFLGETDAVDLH